MFFSYGIKICTGFSSVLSQFMRLTDRRTDGQNPYRYRPRLHSMQRGKNLTLSKNSWRVTLMSADEHCFVTDHVRLSGWQAISPDNVHWFIFAEIDGLSIRCDSILRRVLTKKLMEYYDYSQWRRQLWALGHMPLPPSTSNNFILFHFRVIDCHYPNIV